MSEEKEVDTSVVGEEAGEQAAPEGAVEDGTGVVTTSEEGEEEVVEDTSEEGEAVSAEDEKKFSQPDVNRIVAKAKGRDRRENRELKARIARLEENGAPAPQVAPTGSPGAEPQEDDFDTTAEFTKATVAYQLGQERNAEASRAKGRSKVEAAAEMEDKFFREVEAEGFYEKYPDYEEVIDGALFSDDMAELVLTSKHKGEIMYYLGNNIDEAEKIGRMSTARAAQAIARLEVKLAPKPKKKATTKAPAPINPVKGKDAPPLGDVGKLPYDDFKKAYESGQIK